MGSSWRKAKFGLGLHLCAYNVPRTHLDHSDEDDDDGCNESLSSAAAQLSERYSGAALLSPPATPSSHGMKMPKSWSGSSKKNCSICLASMKRGEGHAIFTAECSHSFHFQCIASNVKHGNQVCPICRAKWKDIPLQFPSLDPQNNVLDTVTRFLPHPRLNQVPEPSVFGDDESLGHQLDSTDMNPADSERNRMIKINMFPEVPSYPRFEASDHFAVLVHLEAPASVSRQNLSRSRSPHVPIDLVTVLDISGSMAGTKLALLKRAMGFVIQNLGPNDRLAVVAFSSTACRLFPLLRMSGRGKHKALQAVNSLVANGWTNIAEGLRKGAKIMEDRREKNPIASIILLSDGQYTHSCGSTFTIPVHAFGFGADHDASAMHSISERSGGTFSFIETESAIQDAFAQCIAGLLSVVVKELELNIVCVDPGVRVGYIRAGSYSNCVSPDGLMGSVDVGDLSAEEEKDFLVLVNMPTEFSGDETSLLKVSCVYKDPLTKETIDIGSEELRIKRPEAAERAIVSLEVDRQRNRFRAAEAMSRARTAAENGDLVGATSVLENCRKALAESASAKSLDRLCIALDAELKEMQERMASRHVYEASGRAYVLSGLSSHSWQRATARGDSTDESSLVRAYQTPSMIEMVTHSRATLLASPSAQRLVRPVLSFGLQPKPR